MSNNTIFIKVHLHKIIFPVENLTNPNIFFEVYIALVLLSNWIDAIKRRI